MFSESSDNQKSSYQHINQPGADTADEVVRVKAFRTPAMLQIGSKHRQVKQIEKKVKESAVKEEVCKWLPDTPVKNNAAGREAEPIEPKPLARFVKQQRRNRLQEKN